MSYSINLKSFQKDFSQQLSKCSLLELQNGIDYIEYETANITEEIYIRKASNIIKNSINIESTQTVDGFICIGILLNGEISYKDNFLNKYETIKKNNIKIEYINAYDMTTNLYTNSSSIGIIIKDNFIENNFSKLLDIHSKDFSSLPSVTLKNQISKNIPLATELYNCPFTGELQNIYLQSKVLELIYHEFLDILNPNEQNHQKKVKLTNDDIERLHFAKDIIINEKSFPDLMTLSKRCAINEFKLKYGFKELFNTTIYQLVLEQKMTYAKYLLETSEFSIAEISNFVGYAHQQSFTNAFVKFFGFPPKDIMVKRKYYF
ncbi:helix-turn-helix domain-containing protein [Aliarcobacter vitoriensis]|uniref:AraC family transcriptional regulator n=1 Tax=Aliarcobacter vitoriensis TaxID=2011099 RepID=A0A366MPE9_9BACT|nr:AraC family transcriptional regulator [Aliarcobacter vitoriensis]RBQ28151.1 AraC family transcriptional regulator [Aliarcobacter vitoriensis]